MVVSLWGLLAGLAMTGLSVIVGERTLYLAFGNEFGAALPVLVLLMLSKSIYLGGVTLLPVTLTLDLSGRFFAAVVRGTVAFYAVAFVLIGPLGLVGIGIAHLAFEVVWAASGWHSVVGRIRRLECGSRSTSQVTGAAISGARGSVGGFPHE